MDKAKTQTAISIKKSRLWRDLASLAILTALGFNSLGWTFSYFVFFTGLAASWLGASRFSTLPPVFRPFIIYVLLRTGWQIGESFLLKEKVPANPYDNLFVLAESLLICWQIGGWKNALLTKKIVRLIMVSFILVWSVEAMYAGGITERFHWFRIFYSTVLTLVSLDMACRAAIGERNSVLQNPVFLLCFGLSIYLPVQVLTETYYMNTPDMSIAFRNAVSWHTLGIAILINIIYLKTMLCIPEKARYSSLY